MDMDMELDDDKFVFGSYNPPATPNNSPSRSSLFGDTMPSPFGRTTFGHNPWPKKQTSIDLFKTPPQRVMDNVDRKNDIKSKITELELEIGRLKNELTLLESKQ